MPTITGRASSLPNASARWHPNCRPNGRSNDLEPHRAAKPESATLTPSAPRDAWVARNPASDRWPQLFDKIGGLWVLDPAHAMGAYLFLAFFIGHLYLATTGTTPWSLLRAMITGYEKRVQDGA
jgi:hypothetical protein